ncbi:uncharacterized protein LOC62_04G006109 [Vanrija pseudolonga]|uniref:Uncharacterized protein n=1 Tax=Vanrija pseudolonga TaxID=143232 RepID=A0AAF0YD55_9TREE|nr:hypothetical protein LOC62_04G006109 [Vanrija pseudolonga]
MAGDPNVVDMSAGPNAPSTIAEVLDLLTPETLELRLNDHAIGDDGILEILRKLAVYRFHPPHGVDRSLLGDTLGIDAAAAAYDCPYSADECAARGVRVLDLARTQLTIPGMCWVFAYAALDVNLVSVDLSRNSMADWRRFMYPAEPALDDEGNPQAIQVPDELHNIYTMTWDMPASNLAQLRMEQVAMSDEVAGAFVNALRDVKSLETLSLRGNRFGEEAVRSIAGLPLNVLRLELDGCGLSLGSMAWILRSYGTTRSICDLSLANNYEEFEEGNNSGYDPVDVESDNQDYEPIREGCVALGKRNYKLRERVGAALKRFIAPARILLHPTAGSPTPIAALPPNVLDLILKHVSGDPGALSAAQWTKVLEHARDRTTILRAARRISVVTRSRFTGVGDDERAFEDWRRSLGCAYWRAI